MLEGSTGIADALAHLDALIGLLGRLGIPVRREHLGGAGGGICTIRGARVMFDDLDADRVTRVESAAKALGSLPDSESVYIPPAIRDLIEQAMAEE